MFGIFPSEARVHAVHAGSSRRCDSCRDPAHFVATCQGFQAHACEKAPCVTLAIKQAESGEQAATRSTASIINFPVRRGES